MRKNEDPAHQFIVIRPTATEYAEQLEDLMHAAYGTTREAPIEVFTAAMYRKHIEIFPEGQFMALDTRTDRVVGVTISLRMHFDPRHHHTERWWQSIGDGWLTTHVPHGEWMYGVESCVHPDYRGAGVGSKLMDARFSTLRRLNLRGMVAGSAIVNYYQYADQLSVEDYVQEVAAGKIFDTNLTKQLHKGFKAHYPIPNYVTDEESLFYGVLITWENADYRPERRGGDGRGMGLYAGF